MWNVESGLPRCSGKIDWHFDARTGATEFLDPELAQVMVEMLVHQNRPFIGCEPAEEGVRMRRASSRTGCDNSVYQSAEPLLFLA